MNRRMIFYVLCVLLRMEAVCMLPALIIAAVLGERQSAWGFFMAVILCGAVSLLTFLRRPRTQSLTPRDAFLTVAIGWLVASLFGSLPFSISGAVPSFTDSVFETVSGFTTTGASILTDVESMSKSLLYWRSFTHWLGGMGVLVLLLAIMPASRNAGGMHILRAESPGPQVDKLVPRLGNSAKILYIIYIALTALQMILLLAGGMPLFESVTTALGTAGTGGFAVLGDSMASYSPYLQNVVTVFMLIFGVNFNIFYLLMVREFYKVLKSTEIWVYLGLFAASVLLITVNIYPQFHTVGESVQQAAFQVASVMTTTGFATVDFNLWPQFSKMVLLTLMFCGACAGSTGGGIKTARLIIVAKAFRRDLLRMIRPRSVVLVRMDGHSVDEDTIRTTLGFVAAYVLIMGASVLLVALNNFSFETTVTSVVACLNNIGPGFDMVGPMGSFASFSPFSKWVLTADMLIGRLELFPILMLVFPSAYRRW
ncbi:MAG: TrkH family potassium uptake protein [Clostridia bacterium]|nr:TrkH family potassium uptake protein [Clostridia bacterium]